MAAARRISTLLSRSFPSASPSLLRSLGIFFLFFFFKYLLLSLCYYFLILFFLHVLIVWYVFIWLLKVHHDKFFIYVPFVAVHWLRNLRENY